MDAAPSSRAPHRPTEEEAVRDPAALAGRTLLEARLARLTPGQLHAFREAVRRCYASSGKD